MIGSIVPDFPYFIREFGAASFAHTVAGALCVSVPIGLVLYLTLGLCFRRIAGVLPHPHSSFLLTWGIDRSSLKSNFLAIVIAIFAGALSHNFVDSFTHQSGAAVSLFPVLAKESFSIHGESFHVFRILQYSGSAIGMTMILAAYGFALHRYCRARKSRLWQDFRRWMALLALTGIMALIAAAVNANFIPGRLDLYAFRVFGFKFLITWIPLIGVAFLGYALFRGSQPTTNSEQGVDPNA